MSKRIFTTDDRAEFILGKLKNEKVNLSNFINQAMLDKSIPIFSSELRTESLFYIDYMRNGAKDWTGVSISLGSPENTMIEANRRLIGRSIEWLKYDHHIKDNTILNDIFSYFKYTPLKKELLDNEHIKNIIEIADNTLKEKDPKYVSLSLGLVSLSQEILSRWSLFWDTQIAYEVLISTIYVENMFKPIKPLIALNMVKRIENQYIFEMVRGKNFI